MATAVASTEQIERVAKALCANDYVRGPRIWDAETIERRWAELDPEDIQHYTALADAAIRAMGDAGGRSG